MQKTSLKRYSCLPTKVSPTSMGFMKKAWLSKIAVRKCLDFLKAAGRRSIPTEDIYFSQLPDLENHSSPEEQYLQSDLEQQVFRICSGLKSPYKGNCHCSFSVNRCP